MKHFFDEIHTVDIVDCNAGEHGHPFATNFNPEIKSAKLRKRASTGENGRGLRLSR
jgi:saccharopine dehydrogenase (NAD+, L-lysine-forming)